MTLKPAIQRLLLASPGAYRLARQAYGLARFAARIPHDRDFAYFHRFEGANGLFLDIGANSGISALSYRLFDRTSCILSVEPNPYHERDLKLVKRLLRRDFRYGLFAAGEQNGETSLWLPVHRGVPLTGEASTVRDVASKGFLLGRLARESGTLRSELTELRVPVRRIDDLALAPHAVKIDVEGAEFAVLRGMPRTLERHRPVLLLEASLQVAEIIEYLAPMGYQPFVYQFVADVLHPFTGQSVDNIFFLCEAVARKAG